jgi:membrane-associated protein
LDGPISSRTAKFGDGFGISTTAMTQILEIVREYGNLVYALLFVYAALKSGSLPLFAGIAAQAGALDPLVAGSAAFAGGYLGDEARFCASRRYGDRIAAKYGWLAPYFARAASMLSRYGTWYIFLYRYPKGMRTVGAFPIGLTSIRWIKFTLLNAASALVWAALLVGSGYALGAAIADAVEVNFGIASVALLVVGLICLFLGFRFTVVRETRT